MGLLIESSNEHDHGESRAIVGGKVQINSKQRRKKLSISYFNCYLFLCLYYSFIDLEF